MWDEEEDDPRNPNPCDGNDWPMSNSRLIELFDDNSTLSNESDDTVFLGISDIIDYDSDGDYIENDDELEDSPISYVYSACTHRMNLESIMLQIPLVKLSSDQELVNSESPKSFTEAPEQVMEQDIKKKEKNGLHLCSVKPPQIQTNKCQMITRSKDKRMKNIEDTLHMFKDSRKLVQMKKKTKQQGAPKKKVKKNISGREKRKIDASINHVMNKVSRLNNELVKTPIN